MLPTTTTCLEIWARITLDSVRTRTHLARERARDERGAAMTEYGLLLVLVGIAAFAALALFGGEIWELFRETNDATDAREVPPPPD